MIFHHDITVILLSMYYSRSTLTRCHGNSGELQMMSRYWDGLQMGSGSDFWMVLCCFGCTNWSDGEKNKSYFWVLKVATHKGEKFKKLTEKQWQTWIMTLHLKSGGAESDIVRVCSNHVVKGKAVIILILNITYLAKIYKNTDQSAGIYIYNWCCAKRLNRP